MAKRILGILLALLLVLGSGSGLGLGLGLVGVSADGSGNVTPKDFKDLSDDFWAMPAIRAMVANGIFDGYDDGTFRPDLLVTRGQFAKVMVLALGLPVEKKVSSSFVDMTQKHWALPFVEAARTYLTGFKAPNGIAFRPDVPAVREDMAVAIVKALGVPLDDESILNEFSDGNLVSKNLRPYVATAINKGLMKGTVSDDGKRSFRPMGQLTRAETAQLLLNLNVLIDDKIILPENDKIILDGDWSAYRPETAATLFAKRDSSYIELKWISDIKQSELKYFKVVASVSDKTPQYPENGYAAVLSSVEDKEFKLEPGMPYNGGDFNTFEAGKTYFVAITTVYQDDSKKTSNVVRITMPGGISSTQGSTVSTAPSSSSSSSSTGAQARVAPVITSKFDDGGIELDWFDPVAQSDLQYFKVVASRNDSTPSYPDNGYAAYFDSADVDDMKILPGMGYNGGDVGVFTSGTKYYFTVTTVYKDGTRLTSNVLEVTLP